VLGGFAVLNRRINAALHSWADDGKTTASAGPSGVFSGQGKCRNQPSCAGKKDEGPIPPGEYEMEYSTKYGGSWWLKDGNQMTRKLCKDLDIGRCEFFLHAGSVSIGCVTLQKTDPKVMQQFENVKKILKHDPKNTMTVIP
jgi:hypothetical protein